MRAACSGAAPPKAIMVRPAVSLPFSTAWTRAALAMVSVTISVMPSAAVSAVMASGVATAWVQAVTEAAGSSEMKPP